MSLCERRGLDVEGVDVYLDNNRTPLPLLTSETSWLSGRTLRIRGEGSNQDETFPAKRRGILFSQILRIFRSEEKYFFNAKKGFLKGS